jgi:hypothetical protein
MKRQYLKILKIYYNDLRLINDICFYYNFSTIFKYKFLRFPLLLIRPLGL